MGSGTYLEGIPLPFPSIFRAAGASGTHNSSAEHAPWWENGRLEDQLLKEVMDTLPSQENWVVSKDEYA